MAGNHELLFKFFEKNSSKLKDIDCKPIFQGLIIVTVVYYFLIKTNYAGALPIAIIFCVSYLLFDILFTSGAMGNCTAVGKKLDELYLMNSSMVNKELKLKEALNKIMAQNKAVVKQNVEIIKQNEELKNQMGKVEKEVEDIPKNVHYYDQYRYNDRYEQYGEHENMKHMMYTSEKFRVAVEDLKSMKDFAWENYRMKTERRIEKEEKFDKLMSDLSNHLKVAEEEKKVVSLLEEKCASLTMNVESERIHCERLKEGKETLKRYLEVEKQKMAEYLQLDRDRNSSYLKYFKEEISELIQSEIGREMDHLLESVEEANDEAGLEVMTILEDVEDKLDDLVKSHKDYHSKVAESIAKNIVSVEMLKTIEQKIVRGVMDEIKERFPRAPSRDTSSESSDDGGHEVVEEI